MIEGLLLTFFIFVVPIFNKNIDYSESIVFYCIPIIISVFVLINHKAHLALSKKQILTQSILIVLALPALIFSISPSHSYYGFFIFLNTILTINLAIILIKNQEFIKWLIYFSSLYSIILIFSKLHLLTLSAKPFGDNFIMQYWGHSYFADFLIFSIPAIIFSNANPLFLIINVIALIFTNSRSALIGIVIALLFLKPKNKILKNGLLIFLLLSSLILWLQVINGKIPQKNTSGRRTDYWNQAIKGFTDRPIFGNGFGTFSIVSEKYRSQTVDKTGYAHNSILSSLCDNGIIFTVLVLIIIAIQLKSNYHKNNLSFAILSGLLFHSLFDPVFNSPGITILAFYVLLKENDSKKNISKKQSVATILFLAILTTLIGLHAISKTLSDYYYIFAKNYSKSIFFDPFNINPRIKIINTLDPNSSEWQKNSQFAQKIAPQELYLYQSLMLRQDLPETIPYFYKLFESNPKGNCTDYLKIANYYRDNKQIDNLNKILQLIDVNFKENEFPEHCAIPISKINYNLAIENYKDNPDMAIQYLKRCIKLIPKLSHYHIDLANTYWFTKEKEKALNQIHICTSQPESQEHCQHYLDQHRDKDFDLPGQKEIKDYIKSYVR